jgi:hypothetical protein
MCLALIFCSALCYVYRVCERLVAIQRLMLKEVCFCLVVVAQTGYCAFYLYFLVPFKS